ncbi:hypothetical protein [Lentibacillus kimchii]|uniref:Uncharacterized protein n=1 Tax=Lentibacillus kimchii TaxID=1542911 RepID=A0ABW2UTI7_9BACI
MRTYNEQENDNYHFMGARYINNSIFSELFMYLALCVGTLENEEKLV